MTNFDEEEGIPGLSRILQARADREKAMMGELHPDQDRLALYHAQRLAEAEADQIRDHLTICRSCVSFLLEFAEFSAPQESEPESSTRAKFDLMWARLGSKEKTGKTAGAKEPPRTSLRERLIGRGFKLYLAYAMAAVLLAVSLALGYWIWSLSREKQSLVAQLSDEERAQTQRAGAGERALAEKENEIKAMQQQRAETERRLEQLSQEADQAHRELNALKALGPNLPVIVFPMDRKRAVNRSDAQQPRSTSNSEVQNDLQNEFSIDSSIARFDVLIPNPLPDFSIEKKDFRYDLVVVRESSGQKIWSTEGLTPDKDGYFSALLPSRLFPSGKYRFTIYGNDAGKRVLITEIVSSIQFKREGPQAR